MKLGSRLITQSQCKRMIGVSNHLQNAKYLASISILRRWARIPRVTNYIMAGQPTPLSYPPGIKALLMAY